MKLLRNPIKESESPELLSVLKQTINLTTAQNVRGGLTKIPEELLFGTIRRTKS